MNIDRLIWIMKPSLLSLRKQVLQGSVDPSIAHIFWLYPIIRLPPNKFIKALTTTLENIPENRVLRVKEPKFHPGYCKCGYEGTMIDLHSITSANYGRYSEGFCPAAALTHIFLSKLNLIVVVMNKRIDIDGMKNIYPKNINASFLVRNGKIKIRDVMNKLRNIDEMKLIAYSPRYLSFLATDAIQASMKNVIYYPDFSTIF